jgi:FkbM family methyltransferase
LYRRHIVDWLSDRALVAQLPWVFRAYARFCSAQRGDPLGAEALLRLIIAVRRRLGLRAPVALTLSGLTFHLDLQDPRFVRIPGEIGEVGELLSSFLRPGDSFVDIGANHGSYSIVASRRVTESGCVIAVEPQARLVDTLRRSLAEGPARFDVHQAACGESSGEVELFVPLASSGQAGLFQAYSARCRHRRWRVAMRRLDELVDATRLPGRLVLKVDVEGAEVAVLRGARQVLATARPVLLVEVNAAALAAAGSSPRALVELLAELGYDRRVTRAEPRREVPLHAEITEHDIIALHARTS